MEEIKTQAIVIRAQDYKDSGKMLTIFSLEHGIMYVKINGVLKPKAKLAFAGQPFCFGEFVLVQKYGYTAINCTSIENFFELTQDFDKFIAGEGILEIVSILGRMEEPNPELFLSMLKALKLLNYTNAVPLAVFAKFLIEALAIGGFKLSLQKCAKCGNANPAKERFSFDIGGRVCSICAGDDSIEITAGEVSILKTIDSATFENLQNLNFSSLENLCEVTKLLIKYFYDKTGENLKGVIDYL